jgi:hypothetical protein
VAIADSTNENLFISPNPTTGKFKVRLYSLVNNILPRTLNVYDVRGNRVYSRTYTVETPYESMDVDISNMNAGVYFVEVGDLNGKRLKVGTIMKL